MTKENFRDIITVLTRIVQLERRTGVEINVDVRSRIPIYEQLVTQIKQMTLFGTAQPDEKLPSVRQLSAELGINPNTIQKAYTELERRGVIYTAAGRGCFISADVSALEKEHRENIFSELFEKICAARDCGISEEEIAALCNKVYKGGTDID